MHLSTFSLILLVLGTPASSTLRCQQQHQALEPGLLPEEGDFVQALFDEYGDNTTCRIYEDDFDRLLTDLNVAGHTPGHDHDHGHDHDEDEAFRAVPPPTRRDAALAALRLVQMTLADLVYQDDLQELWEEGEQRGIAETCLDAEELLATFQLNASAGLGEADVVRLSTALVQQAAQGCKKAARKTPEKPLPSKAEAWGYGLLSVILISACAPFGLIIAKWQDSATYKYIMTLFLGLAVGALMGDALLHLVPEALGAHSHGEGGEEEHSDLGTWKMTVVCMGIWGFFVLQMFLMYASSNKEASEPVTGGTIKAYENHALEEVQTGSGAAESEKVVVETTEPLAEPALGWMVAIGDAFHNFSDGLVVGATYAYDINLGVSTTIAIVVHEIPHEFGDTAAMLSTGWSWKKVLVMQLVSQSTCLLGLFIGIPVAGLDGAVEWIMVIAAGLFLYVALCDVVPCLFDYYREYMNWLTFLLANLGIGLGLGFLLIVALFEDQMKI